MQSQPWRLSLATLLCVALSCGQSEPQVAQPQDAAADLSALPDQSSVMELGTQDQGQTMSGCAPTAPLNCVYPSQQLTITEREGLSITEPVTQRQLPLLVRQPSSADQPLPVVIWSHGGSFNDQGHKQSKAWSEVFAAHGYAAIHLAHTTLTLPKARLVCAELQLSPEECLPDLNADEDSDGFLAIVRTLDLHAIINELERLSRISQNNGGPAFDLGKVVVAGWSGGSRAPAMIMGAQVKVKQGGALFSKPHALPAAAILMSPTGPGFGGFFEDGPQAHAWTMSRGPVLMATGINDVKPNKPELDGPTRKKSYELQSADDQRWMLYSTLELGHGEHGTYNLGDLGAEDEALNHLSLAITSAARAFLDAHLKQDAAAHAWLKSQDAQILGGEAQWLHK